MAVEKPLKRYEVRVGDCSLKLKSSHDSATLNEIVQVVEKQICFSRRSNQSLSMQKTYALSCLNVAEELVCLKQVLRSKLDRLESSTRKIFSELKSSSKGALK